MEFVIDKNLEDITPEDIKSLVKNRVPEGLFVDFKRDNYGHSYPEKKELLKDVSAFANANGGDLIIGVDEGRSNEAQSITGVYSDNIADEVTRLEQIIQSGLAPKLNTFKVRYIDMSKGKYVVVIRVKQSPLFPHMIILQKYNKFYIRKSDRNLLLDAYELRNVFLRSDNIMQRIREYHQQRVSVIYSSRMPVPLREGAKVVLHVIPYTSLVDNFRINLSDRNHELDLGLSRQRINFDGVIASGMDERGFNSYCQLYHNGVLEYVDSSREIFEERKNKYYHNEMQNVIDGSKYGFEKYLTDKISHFVDLMMKLQISVPYYLFVSFVDVKGYRIFYGQDSISRYYIDRNMLTLPEIEIKSITEDFKGELKSIYDMVWNACGIGESMA